MKLFEPEKPFELLSINALVPMTIDGQTWQSVANYTQAQPHQLGKALLAKFKQHVDLQYLLLMTGQEPLVDNNDPQNVTGFLMMKMRNQMRRNYRFNQQPLFPGVWLQAWIDYQLVWIREILEQKTIQVLDWSNLLALFHCPSVQEAEPKEHCIVQGMLFNWKSMLDFIHHCRQFEQAKRQWPRQDLFDQELEQELIQLKKYKLPHPIPLVWHRRFWRRLKKYPTPVKNALSY